MIACAQTGTTSAAGMAMNVTQSAVSRSIKSLEDKLGVLLFERVRQRLHLTDAGRLLVQDAERILAQLDQSARTVLAFSGTKQVLRVAVLPTFGQAWLIPRLPRFQAAHPEISLHIGAELGRIDFARDPYDCAVQREELSGGDTVCVPLMTERVVAVAAPSVTRTFGDITSMPLLQQSTRPTMWQEWFEGTEVEIKTLLRGPRFDHFGMVVAAAKAGMGAALVPEVLVSEELVSGALEPVFARRGLTGATYALIHPADRMENTAVSAFRAWLEREIVEGP
ncbi:LysR family transcriptional regulator, glycine cleavage system transcriptional activator [Shimia haliotis]|uniref:LysR family transcriptional regulator, glycine cleavage system transcriptional activator n=1 Tax=Shimia haliotis TaxID=1280847 RepID=A0A1I4F135_9RHOB|nr:LysR family transcriptional regulator, glycine cleavage system transcriptional activator [Shimia haliotis]